MKRQRYQRGTVALSTRKSGENVWVLRYSDGGKRPSKIIGTVRQYPTKSLAQGAAMALSQKIAIRQDVATFAHLVERFREEAMPRRVQTARSYESTLKRLEERWGEVRLDDMAGDVMGIGRWLSSLQTLDGKNDLAQKSRSNVRALLHSLFDRAIAWNLVPRGANPIDFVKLRAVPFAHRNERPKIARPLLGSVQYHAINSDPQLAEHARVIFNVGIFLGLRISETLALRWGDIDFVNRSVHIQRSIVGSHEDDTKTDDSDAHLPLPEELLEKLERWKAHLPSVNGYLFGNPATGRPYHRDSLVADHLKPAGERAGIQSLGSHSLRHSYRALMAEHGVGLEPQKRLMRHSNMQMTLEYGRKSISPGMRDGNAKIAQILTAVDRKENSLDPTAFWG